MRRNAPLYQRMPKTAPTTTIQINNVTRSFTISLAEGEGFEPPKVFSLNGFQDRRDRPLCHPSGLGRIRFWQGGRDSNPQPTVLETATLPIELPPYALLCLFHRPKACSPPHIQRRKNGGRGFAAPH